MTNTLQLWSMVQVVTARLGELPGSEYVEHLDLQILKGKKCFFSICNSQRKGSLGVDTFNLCWIFVCIISSLPLRIITESCLETQKR